MNSSAPSLVKGEERALMTLPSDLLKEYPSLRSTEIVQRKLDAALVEEKRKYQQNPRRLIRHHDAHVAKMLVLDAKMAKLKKEYDRLRVKIAEVWAVKGLTEVGGAMVVPQVSLSIAHLEALAQLPPDLRKRVQVLVLDPENFLKLAEETGIPQNILERSITATVARVNITLPKPRKGRPKKGPSAADTLPEPAQSSDLSTEQEAVPNA